MPGRFENFPLTPSVAGEIIRDCFEEQSLWKKNALDVRVEHLHRSQGGVPGKQPLSSAVKRALQDLQAEGIVVSRYGHWQLVETIEAKEESRESDCKDLEAPLQLLDQEVVQEFDCVCLVFGLHCHINQ